MSGSFTLDLVCDYRDPRSGHRCGAWETADTGEETAPTLRRARQLLAREGWTRAYAPSSCGYDLCPDHIGRRPGVDFPDWRKGG